ncbi:MAG: hypothetical protein JJU18_03250 [Oceanicaulis sp.]|nr:hypothetical protein [Oceanicaulis sp.]
MNTDTKFKGCQTIFDRTGNALFPGVWNSQELFVAVTGPLGETYWKGRRVLDIGANTSGLSVEIARRGASVVAIEPDQSSNSRVIARSVLDDVIETEALDITLRSEGLFDSHTLGEFDTVMCLGLVYHFRDQQFVLDYLSTLKSRDLIVSNQTAPGNDLIMVNRMDPSVPVPVDFWKNYKDALSGWHPTRPLFERMLTYAGFTNVTALTDPTFNYPQKPFRSVTNSAYFHASYGRAVDPVASRYKYLAR